MTDSIIAHETLMKRQILHYSCLMMVSYILGLHGFQPAARRITPFGDIHEMP